MFYLLQLTNKCNNNCVFCARVCSFDQLSLDDVYSKVKFLDSRVDTVIVSGGETLMYPNLFNVIRLLKKRNLKVHLQTNATLINEAIALKIASSGINNVIINFSGLKSEYTSITRNPLSFKYAVLGLKNLVKHIDVLNIEVVIVITKLNYKTLVDICKFLNKISPKIVIYFSYIQKCTQSYDMIKKNAVNYDLLKPYLNNALKFCSLNSINFKISHIPLCYIDKDYHSLVVDAKINNPAFLEDFIDVNEVLYFDSEKEKQEFVYLRKCNNCKFKSECVGFPDYYNEVFLQQKNV
ncbi:MAG: radical SAM protein [Candidatus Woesearchaeota archaeon]